MEEKELITDQMGWILSKAGTETDVEVDRIFLCWEQPDNQEAEICQGLCMLVS